jgi:hypothetical protein
MNIKALITMLVLGSSSVAMARPVTASGYAGAPTVRDHRAPAPAPAYEGTLRSSSFVALWVTLGSQSRVADGEMAFRVGPRFGRFSALKLQHSSGKSLINRVEIRFANGHTQVVELNKYLNASNPTITIGLDGDWATAIRNVTVVGRNARSSAFSVLAS